MLTIIPYFTVVAGEDHSGYPKHTAVAADSFEEAIKVYREAFPKEAIHRVDHGGQFRFLRAKQL